MKSNNKQNLVTNEKAEGKKVNKKNGTPPKADHLHKWEDIIVDCKDTSVFGMNFAKRCAVCGRIGSVQLFSNKIDINKAIKAGTPVYKIDNWSVTHC